MPRMLESPWGPLAVCDVHVHFFAHTFFEKLIAQKPGLTWDDAATQLGWTLPTGSAEELAAVWADELGRYNVQGAALIASLPAEHASVVTAAQASSRFLPFAIVNPREWSPEGFDAIRAACL